MNNLPPPDRASARQHLHTALEQYVYGGEIKGHAPTNDEIDTIISLYDHYDQTKGAPSTLLLAQHLPQSLRDSLHHAYGFLDEDRKLAYVRASLLRGIERCPVCGISYPGELDHYLPKASYKALSIYVSNLVPHCHECNKRKSDIVEADPAKHFVHAYFDILPKVQFLSANVSLTGNALDVEFSIGAPPELSSVMRQRLTHQFDRLKLNVRYGRELNTFLMGQASGITQAYDADHGAGVRDYLRRQAAVEIGASHLNHWRPVLFLALADSWDFCDGGFERVLPVPP